jgi:4-diphosphocytidyl-2-C-methyl-D-erythritol kinase
MLDDDIFLHGSRAVARSYAKINLSLDVIGKREDGYHDVRMIMQSLNLSDLIIIDKIHSGISVNTNLRYLPNTEKNIAYRAAQMFIKTTGIHGGVKIKITKNIPVAAGLAGGSGNAAAVLCALNVMYGYPLNDKELLRLGAQLGADVPYCMLCGTYLAEGIGDRLTLLRSSNPMNVLLVKPPVNVSTPAIYEQIDKKPILEHPDTDMLIQMLADGDMNGLCMNMRNVLESVTQTLYPIIGGIKKKMKMLGADGALMSGSGPTVFGLFSDRRAAHKAFNDFCMQFQDVYLTHTKQ